jgi:hypothetical protein
MRPRRATKNPVKIWEKTRVFFTPSLSVIEPAGRDMRIAPRYKKVMREPTWE